MAAGSALGGEARERLRSIGGADLVIGIPSYNNASTIGHVARTAVEGARSHFPDRRVVLINSDGGSSDGTPRVVLETTVPSGVEVMSTAYQGPPGKGSALRAVFEAAVELEAKACVVVDSDLRSITPAWIDLLAGPVLRGGYSYVAPYYARHKYDGTITNNIAYPMTAALYGWRVRQPIGGDFGFSVDLARAYLEQDVWDGDVARFGIDIFMTTTAVASGQPVAQANLGAKVHDPKDPASSLGPMFQQVVGTLFSLMGRYEDAWQAVEESRSAPRLGPELRVEPEPVQVNRRALVESFERGLREQRGLIERVVSPGTLRELEGAAARADGERVDFRADVWARTCYDFAVAFRRRVAPAEQVLASLTPLYFGRTATLIAETWEMDGPAFEVHVDAQAETFERLKPYLRERWEG